MRIDIMFETSVLIIGTPPEPLHIDEYLDCVFKFNTSSSLEDSCKCAVESVVCSWQGLASGCKNLSHLNK
jgi:hypothetical protein